MAFIGIFLMGVALFIIGAIAIATIAMIIAATVLLFKKHKKAAAVLYIIASIPIIAVIVLGAVYSHARKYPKFETYNGDEVVIDMTNVEEMRKKIINGDTNGLNSLLDKHPELIYYLDINKISLLDYGLYNCDTRIMQIAVDHGARFDDEIAHRKLNYSRSLQHFFSELDYWVFAYTFETKPKPKFKTGIVSEEMIQAVKFAIEHGATVKWEYHGEEHTFAEHVEQWIDADGEITDKDQELLDLANVSLQ